MICLDTTQHQFRVRPPCIVVVCLDWLLGEVAWLPQIARKPLSRKHSEMIVDRPLGFGLHEKITLGKDEYTMVGINGISL